MNRLLAKAAGEEKEGNGRREQKIISKAKKVLIWVKYLSLVLRESAQHMREFFNQPQSPIWGDLEDDYPEDGDVDMEPEIDLEELPAADWAMDYDSDTSNEDTFDKGEDEDDQWEIGWSDEWEQGGQSEPSQEDRSSEPENKQRRKRQKWDVLDLVAWENTCKNKWKILESTLVDIEKLVQLRKTRFDGGSCRLQSYRAQAIKSYLRLVICKGYKVIATSETAADAFRFAWKWGGRQVRQWVHMWFSNHELPKSKCGCHVKAHSLLKDPAIRVELWSYVRSNK